MAQDGNTRFIGLELLFRPNRKNRERIFVASIYAPDSGTVQDIQKNGPDVLEDFYEEVERNLNKLEKSTKVIIGGDYNACPGIRRKGKDSRILGPNGYKRANDQGEHMLNLAESKGLKVCNTFFKSRTYWTFINNFNGEKLTLDYFMADRRFGNRIEQTRVYQPRNAVMSDHRPIRLVLRLQNHHRRRKVTDPKLVSDEETQWSLLHRDEQARQAYQQFITQYLLTHDPDTPEQMSEMIMKAAEATLKRPKEKDSNWFAESEATLAPLRKEAREAAERHKTQRTDQSKHRAKETRRNYQQAVRQAKRAFNNELAKKTCMENMKNNPRGAWGVVNQLAEGSYSHHRNLDGLVLNDPDTGKPVTDPSETIKILREYWQKLFNRDDAPTDPTVLEDIEQRRTMYELNDPPTPEETEEAIKGLKNNKAPGQSGVMAEGIKGLPEVGLQRVHNMLVSFWNGTGNFEEWKIAVLRIIWKNKGSNKELSNYRGIVLQDIFARLMSSIISRRLLKILKETGIEEQFGNQNGRGTADAIFVLKNILHTRKSHKLDSHVLFVDLIKAYDTANHELLFALLEKYGAPSHLIDVIRRLHDGFKLEFTLDKNHKCNIDYTVGVRQGDNMAPVLFLFLMQAMAETLQKEWKNSNKIIPSFMYHKSTNNGYTRCQPKPETTKGEIFQLLYTLFVDDTAFIFETRDDLTRGADLLHKHFRRFGLLMHVGITTEDGKQIKSKTEAMYFPSGAASPKETPSKPETPPPVTFGERLHVHYTDVFKYLGSRLTPDLTDTAEIDRRIQQATAQVSKLMNFFKSAASLETKRFIFQSIPLNTVLYGCETWALTDKHRQKLSAFFHKSIRISMKTVKNHSIRNGHLRNKICLDNILDTIRERQFDLLGKIGRMENSRLPRRTLGAWINTKRKAGKPNTTLAHSYVETLQEIVDSEISSKGEFNKWIPLAKNAKEWGRTKLTWKEKKRAETGELGISCLGEPALADWIRPTTEQPPTTQTITAPLTTHHRSS
jgi:hypothetical protein